MIAILGAFAPVVLVTAIGYALVHAKVARDEVWQAVDQLTFYVLFPALLTKTLARADLGSVPAASFAVVMLGSVTIMAALMVTAQLSMKGRLSGPAFTSVFQGSIRFQSIIVVALSGALFGEQGLTFAALSVASIVPAAQTYTVLVLIFFGSVKGDPGWIGIGKRLILNPFLIACLLGLLLNATGMPNFAYETLGILGSASIALSLLSVGAGLNLATARSAGPVVAGSMALRLLGMPLLVIGLGSLAGLHGLGLTVAIIAAGVPTAATAYTMARKMGGDAELMAQIITFQTIGAILTLPLFIYLSR